MTDRTPALSSPLHPRYAPSVARSISILLALSLTPLVILDSACGVPGERAGAGECPEGETCSTTTSGDPEWRPPATWDWTAEAPTQHARPFVA